MARKKHTVGIIGLGFGRERAFQLEERDDPRRVREKVTGKLLTLDESLRPTLPAFLQLLDVPVDDAEWQTPDLPQRRQRMLDAVKRLILREGQVQPVIAVFASKRYLVSAAVVLPSNASPATMKITRGSIFAAAKKLLRPAPAFTPTILIAAIPPTSSVRTRTRARRPCAAGRNPAKYSTKMLALAAPEVSLTSNASHAT